MNDKINIFFTAISFLVIAVACKKDQPAAKPAPTKTIYQLIQEDSTEFSILNTILSKSRLSDTLSRFSDTLRDTGTYTLFAPPDSAFIRAGITRDSVGRMRLDALARMAKYFVSFGTWPASSFPDGAEMQILQMGNALDQNHLLRYAFLTHHTTNNLYYIDGIPLLQHDIPAANGILHKISGMIEHSSQDITTTISLDPRFAYNSKATDDSWQSAKDTTQKTIFFLTASAAKTALSIFGGCDWSGSNCFYIYGIATMHTVPHMVLFDPDFYDLNQRQVPSACFGAMELSAADDTVGSYNPGALTLPNNLQFMLNPAPAVMGPGNNGAPGNILRTPTVIATNGVIHFIDKGLRPTSYRVN